MKILLHPAEQWPGRRDTNRQEKESGILAIGQSKLANLRSSKKME
jgi:hypothetical protein